MGGAAPPGAGVAPSHRRPHRTHRRRHQRGRRLAGRLAPTALSRHAAELWERKALVGCGGVPPEARAMAALIDVVRPYDGATDVTLPDLLRFDAEHVWHPYSAATRPGPAYL